MYSAAYLALFAAAVGTALAQNPRNFDVDTAPRAYSEEPAYTVSELVSQISDGQIQAPYNAQATATTDLVESAIAAPAEQTTPITLTADVPASVSSALAELASIVSAESTNTQIFSILPLDTTTEIVVTASSTPVESPAPAFPTGAFQNTTYASPSESAYPMPSMTSDLVLTTTVPATLSTASRVAPSTITSTAVLGGTVTSLAAGARSSTSSTPAVQTDNAAAAAFGGVGVVGYLAMVAGGFLLA